MIIASFTAIYGISAWKREFKGKRDMELAEDVLCLFYRAERAIEAIRYPIYDLREGQKREQEEKETPEQKQARDKAYVVFMKIKEHGDIFDQLYAKRFRFMARFGKDKAKTFDDLKHIVDKIYVSNRRLAELWALQQGGRDISQETKNRIEEHEVIIWYNGSKDEITPQVNTIIEGVEKICRPMIEVKISYFSVIFDKIRGFVVSCWR